MRLFLQDQWSAFLDRAREDPYVYPLKIRRSEFREIYKSFVQDDAREAAQSIIQYLEMQQARLKSA